MHSLLKLDFVTKVIIQLVSVSIQLSCVELRLSGYGNQSSDII